MSGTTDDIYFEWLYRQIGVVRNRNPSRSYWKLARQLYAKEFIWLVSNDDNRAADGVTLRTQFVDEMGADKIDPAWADLGCSMLEMLIALARRAEYQTIDIPSSDWFWMMMDNLNLRRFADSVYDVPCNDERIDDILETVIYRTYDYDGSGGIFPLKNPATDQRKVELWYQLNGYILENMPL